MHARQLAAQEIVVERREMLHDIGAQTRSDNVAHGAAAGATAPGAFPCRGDWR
jgi:hypothetical protein